MATKGKTTTKEIVAFFEGIEKDLINKYPDSGAQIMNSFRSWMLDVVFAHYVLKNKTEFKSLVKYYGAEVEKTVSSGSYQDEIAGMHDKLFGPDVPEKERAQHISDAIAICKQSVNHLVENMLLVAAHKDPFSKRPTKKIPKGGKLRDINGDEIVL